MIKKISSAFLLTYFAMTNISLAQDFVALEKEEYKSSVLSLLCTTKQEIEGKLACQIPQINSLITPLTNFIELGVETKEILFSFTPYGLLPSFEIPVGFPMDAHNLLMSVVTGQKWIPQDDLPFGMTTGKMTTPTGQIVGSFTSIMQDQPKVFFDKFNQACKEVQQANLTAVCHKNPELMQIVEKLTGSKVDPLVINITNLKNIAKLLCYSLGGKLTSNPVKGTSFTVDMSEKLTIPTKGKMSTKRYKRLLNTLMKNYLSAIGVTFDPEANSFVKVDK